jgi:serine/threonine protein kinase
VNKSLSKQEEIEKNKQKLEGLIASWKAAMPNSENILEYIEHWYDADDADVEYSYILMEYCPGGDLSKKIIDVEKNCKKFIEKVYYIFV